MQKILIAEDDINISADLKMRLQEEGFITDVVYNGLLAEKLIIRNSYDCIILDINMPGKDGLAVCKTVREQGISTSILILTAFDEVEDKVTGFNSGADDYLTKPFYFQELLARIKSLLKRRPITTEVSQVLTIENLSIDLRSKKVQRNGETLKLTSREYEILVLLASSKGDIVSKRDFIEHIWGTRVEVNTNTIEVFINSIRNKIDKNFEPKLIHTRPGYGYFISGKPNES
ncbi:MAG: response regulator transcription factor [Cyclobacteriaceae bacterium]|nr:response regulator transcription factor [Cyclobacteriaceae bacterium]